MGAKSGVLAASVAIKALWVLLKANPITAMITAMTVGAMLIIKYWKPVKEFFVNLWTWITDEFKVLDAVDISLYPLNHHAGQTNCSKE